MIVRHIIGRTCRGLVGRRFSEEKKTKEVIPIIEEFKRFNELRKKVDNQKLSRLKMNMDTSLAKEMDCYEHEIRLELMFPLQDESSAYIESIFNFYGVLYKQVMLAEQ